MRQIVLLLLLAAAAFGQSNSIQICDQQSATACVTIAAPANLGGVNYNEIWQPTADKQILFNTGNTIGGNNNLKWDNAAQTFTVTGITSTLGILSAGGAYVQSSGGFLSTVSGGNWQGFNSPTDGIFVRGYAVDADVAGTSGGYVAFAPISYPPTPGFTCYDAYGNVVSQPTPLPGLSGFGADNIILWNSTSPLQGYHAPFTNIGGQPIFTSGTACAAPIPVISGEPWGINLNAYIFARGGFASDGPEFNMVQIFNGGMVAQSITAAGLYPRGTVTNCCGTLTALGTYLGGYIQVGHSAGSPSAGSISAVNNPLTVGDGLEQGTVYWEDGSTGGAPCLNVYDGSTFFCMAQQFKNVTFNTLVSNGAISAGGVIASNTSAGGVNVPSATGFNSIQAPSGGMEALSFSAVNYVQTGNYSGATAGGPPLTTSDAFHAGAMSYSFAGGCEAVNNGGSWSCIGGSGGSVTSVNTLTGAVTIVGSSPNQITVTTGSNIVIGTPQNIATTSTPTFAGVIANGSFNSNVTGSTIGFQLNSGNFQVDGNGNVSALNVFTSSGASGGFNVTGDTALNSIQTVGGFKSYNGGNCSQMEYASISALANCTLGDTMWAFGTSGTNGILRISNGTGSGGLDGNGAQILAQASTGGLQTIGAISAGGVVTSTGISGGLNVTGNTAYNSIQTVGGILASFDVTATRHFQSVGSTPTTSTSGCTIVSGSNDNRGQAVCGPAVNTVLISFANVTSAPFCMGGAIQQYGNVSAIAANVQINVSAPANFFNWMCQW